MASNKIATPTRPTVEQWFEELALISLCTPHHEDNPLEATCRWGQPAIFWGGSGIGKSARIKQAAKKAGLTCEVVFPSQRQPEDFSGVLTPNPSSPEGVSIECLLPPIRKLMRNGGNGVLFIDEASNAPPAVQGAMLGMLLDRMVGDNELLPTIRILLAANPPEIAAGGYGLEPPTANRIGHFFVGAPSFEQWETYYTNRFATPTPPVNYVGMVREGWSTHAPIMSGTLVGFLKSNGAAKDDQPKAHDPAGGFAWPSGRTWEMAVNAMIARRAIAFPEELDNILVTGFVGEARANEFAVWRREAKLPTPETVLSGGWAHDPRRLDITAAVLATIVPYVGMKQKGDEREAAAVATWQLFHRMIQAHAADLAVKPMSAMINKHGLGMTGDRTTNEIKNAALPVISWLGHNGYQQFITQ
jgi:hypothetical protein